MNLLFICSRNQWRSPTAQQVFGKQHATRSAGTSDVARTRISEKHILWADVVFAMERKHKQIIAERFKDSIVGKKVIVLNIPDEYTYMDAALVQLLTEEVQHHLDQL